LITNTSRLSPEILEPMRRKLGVAHRVLDVFVAEPCLQRPGVVAGIGKGVAACRACSCGRANGRRSTRPGAIADRIARKPEAHACRRSGSWSRSDARSGSTFASALHASLVHQAGKQTWPITGATFAPIYKQQQRRLTAIEMLRFLTGHIGPAPSWPTSCSTSRCRKTVLK
jgi:hypothetical protein